MTANHPLFSGTGWNIGIAFHPVASGPVMRRKNSAIFHPVPAKVGGRPQNSHRKTPKQYTRWMSSFRFHPVSHDRTNKATHAAPQHAKGVFRTAQCAGDP